MTIHWDLDGSSSFTGPVLPRVVGLSGRARAGKDTAAAYLVQRHGYRKVAFADVLREAALALDPLIGPSMRWAELHHTVGYEAAKDHPVYGAEFRRVLMRLGTEAGRGVLGEDVWVKATFDRMEPTRRYVVSDVRFPNEATAVKAHGGVVLRLERAESGPPIDHSSETALKDWRFDAVVANDDAVEDLHDNLDDALSHLRRHPLGPFTVTVAASAPSPSVGSR